MKKERTNKMNTSNKHLRRDLFIAYFIFLGLTTILYIHLKSFLFNDVIKNISGKDKNFYKMLINAIYILHIFVLTKMYIPPIIKNKKAIQQ